MTVLAKKKARACAATRKDGRPCSGHVLSDEGATKLLDRGISLVADPTAFCSFHARTPEERHEMSAKGGSWSPKDTAVNSEEEPERDPMPDEILRASRALIRDLLAATIPNVHPVEPDVRKRALGVYLALAMFDPATTAISSTRCCPARSTTVPPR